METYILELLELRKNLEILLDRAEYAPSANKLQEAIEDINKQLRAILS